MHGCLAGFAMWPNNAWLPVTLMILLITYLARKDGKMWNDWAALVHFLFAGVAGLSWVFGQTTGATPDSIYYYFSPYAFWINFLMMLAHLGVVWANHRAEKAARA